ncbi:unnamed protein product, partial [Urochloa humidicola]
AAGGRADGHAAGSGRAVRLAAASGAGERSAAGPEGGRRPVAGDAGPAGRRACGWAAAAQARGTLVRRASGRACDSSLSGQGCGRAHEDARPTNGAPAIANRPTAISGGQQVWQVFLVFYLCII